MKDSDGPTAFTNKRALPLGSTTGRSQYAMEVTANSIVSSTPHHTHGTRTADVQHMHSTRTAQVTAQVTVQVTAHSQYSHSTVTAQSQHVMEVTASSMVSTSLVSLGGSA